MQGCDNQLMCRICFSELETELNPLISPCKCSGSLKHIHINCLRTWLSRKENVLTSNAVISYSWKAFHCELCKTEYADKHEHMGKQLQLFEISKPKTNYVVLESLFQSTTQAAQPIQKTLHVVNFNQQQQIKIGRGHDNDLRISDISVSRCHTLLRKGAAGTVIVEDNQSKFGTLVLVKQPLVMSEHFTYYLQSGRSIMKIQPTQEWGLFQGILKPNFNRKYETEEKTCNDPNKGRTGDKFYDYFGKFCLTQEATGMSSSSSLSQSEVAQEDGGVQERGVSLLSHPKTNQFKIKL